MPTSHACCCVCRSTSTSTTPMALEGLHHTAVFDGREPTQPRELNTRPSAASSLERKHGLAAGSQAHSQANKYAEIKLLHRIASSLNHSLYVRMISFASIGGQNCSCQQPRYPAHASTTCTGLDHLYRQSNVVDRLNLKGRTCSCRTCEPLAGLWQGSNTKRLITPHRGRFPSLLCVHPLPTS